MFVDVIVNGVVANICLLRQVIITVQLSTVGMSWITRALPKRISVVTDRGTRPVLRTCQIQYFTAFRAEIATTTTTIKGNEVMQGGVLTL